MDAISYCALQKDHERPLSLQIIPCGKSLHHLMIVMVAVSHYPLGASSDCAFPNDSGASACPCRGSAWTSD